MKHETISSREFVFISILFLTATPSMTCLFRMAENDTWLAALAGAVFAVPLILVYARIASLYPGMGLYDILYAAMGKFLGWLFSLLMVLYAVALCGLNLREFTEFIQLLSLRRTPQLFLAVTIALVCAWVVRHGVESLARVSPLMVGITLLILVVVDLMLAGELEWKRMLPVANHSLEDIGLTAYAFLVYPLGEAVLLLSLCGNLEKSGKRTRLFLVSMLATVGILLNNLVRNTLTLGNTTHREIYFPSYVSTSLINIGDFLQRIEVLITVTAVVCLITKISLCIYAGCLGLAKLTGSREYKPFAFPLGLFVAVWAVLAFHNTMELFMVLYSYLFIAPLFQVALPLVLWVTAEIRTMTGRRGQANRQPEPAG